MLRKLFSRTNRRPSAITLTAGILVLLTLVLFASIGSARHMPSETAVLSPMHPTFILRDADGASVVESGKPLSTMATCGECHDSAYIASHSFHADLGLADLTEDVELGASTGLFGGWDPIRYRYLSQEGDELLDLGTAEWIMQNAARIVGGGPGTTSRAGVSLSSDQGLAEVDTIVLDQITGKPTKWDWQASGTLEMDCFLCHSPKPNTAERVAEIRSGKFASASTATLLGSGLVERGENGFIWNTDAFNEDGSLKQDRVAIQDPLNTNCASCHGEVHPDIQEPLVLAACDGAYPLTQTTGQVIASQKVSESGINLANKSSANRSWDVHAERALECTDCHYSINNPVHSQETAGTSPEHLQYDPRKLTIGEYLQAPNHNFARGQSAQYNIDPENKGTMRRCESCHNATVSHDGWLPYSEQHMNVLACESCHIPQMYAPALQMMDWTFINADSSAGTLCRGITGTDTISNLVTGYEPILMQRNNVDGGTSLTPYNLVSSWYWVYDDASGNKRPVRLIDLEKVFLADGSYSPEVVAEFDEDGDGQLSALESRIVTAQQAEFVAGQLTGMGLVNPRIEAQVQPYSINHNVADGDHAISDCSECHNSNSRVAAQFTLANYVPGGVIPQFAKGTNVNGSGDMQVRANGSLAYTPVNTRDGIYVFGKDGEKTIDWIGALLFVGTLLGVTGHATLRYLAASRLKKAAPNTKPVYVYEAYERFWHWLQALSILILVFTGLVIHRPDLFGAFSFKNIVIVHNVFAGILVINAALSLFWHLTTGEIKQYIPRPAGFFDDAIVQAKYYVSGIFKGDPHPFEKNRNRKMNPLQQATYFGLLNVLLPFQIIGGLLMWGVQKWPQYVSIFGGLQYVAIFHSLIAWLLASFIVGHIYLTTTGATPLEAMRGMVTGWEELESHGNETGEHEAKE